MDCCESLEDGWRLTQSMPYKGYRTKLSHFLKDPLIDLDVENQTSLERITLLEDLIHEYAQKELSKDDDSLNVVSAFLQYMQRVIFQDGFLCGLPLANFRNSILWHGNDSSTIFLYGPTVTRRRSDNIPSWSWAAYNLNNRINFPRTCRFLDAWVKPLNPTLRITSYGEMEIDVDKSINRMGGSDSRDFDLEDCPQIQQMTSASLAFYNRGKAKPIRDLSDSFMPVAMQGPVSDHSILWVEGIILQFKMSFGYIKFSGPLGEYECEVYYWQPQTCPTLSKWKGADFLLVSVRADRVSGLRLDLLHLFWEDGIAFRAGVVSIDVYPYNAKDEKHAMQHCVDFGLVKFTKNT
jgi:hypothetical protein